MSGTNNTKVRFASIRNSKSLNRNNGVQQNDKISEKYQEKSSSYKKALDARMKKLQNKTYVPRVSSINTIESGGVPQYYNGENDLNLLVKSQVSSQPPNGGWGWVVTLSSFFINTIIIGMHNSFSILYLNLIEEFKSTLSETAWVGSIAFGSILLFAPLSGILANMYGCRIVALFGVIIASICLFISSFAKSISILYFTYGFGYGFGTSLCYMQGTVMVSRYFTTKRALASGIALSGSSLGALVMAPFYYALQAKIGWRNALQAIAGCTFLTVSCAATYRPLQKPGSSTTEERIKSSPARKFVLEFSLWKNKAFLVWAVAVALNKVGYLVPWVHMVKFSDDVNSPEYGPRLIQFMGVGATLSRLIIGKVVDMSFLNRQHIAQFSTCAMGVVNIIHAHIRNKSGITFYAIALGALDGGVEILLPIMTLELVGAENLSVAWGCILAVISLSSLGPPIAGQIRDNTGSYFWSFYFTGAPMILSGFVLALIPWAKRQHQEPATSILSINPSHLEIRGDPHHANFASNIKPWISKFFKPFRKNKSFSNMILIPSTESLDTKPFYKPVPLPGT